MTKPFSRDGDAIRAQLSDPERALIADYADMVAALLADDADAPAPTADTSADEVAAQADPLAALEAEFEAPAPPHPALARLLPDASKDDPQLAQSFRRLTEQDLRSRKHQALADSADLLRRAGDVKLTESQAVALAKALTDIRLLLAQQLDLQTDEDADLLHERIEKIYSPALGDGEHDTPVIPEGMDETWLELAVAYDAMTWWQGSLMETLG